MFAPPLYRRSRRNTSENKADFSDTVGFVGSDEDGGP
jgi:hypothetical protein